MDRVDPVSSGISDESFDLVVVGAGPAGSTAALAALRAKPDARVLLLDRAPLGSDKVCGDGIAPHAGVALRELGVEIGLPSEIVDRVRLVSPRGREHSAIVESPGHVIPRQQFDERLLRAAIDAGAQFRQERVTSIAQGPGSGPESGARGRSMDTVVVNGRWRASAVVGADGSNSVVRKLVGQRPNRGAAMAIAIRGYARTPAGIPREMTLRWDSQRAGGLCYAWSFPTAQGTSNVGYGMSESAVTGGRAQLEERMRALLPEFDFDGVELTGHTLPLTISRPALSVGRVLLTGDAASLINPFTGEGIYSAIASGAIAGRAAVTDPSSAGAVYRRELLARFGKQYRQTKLMYPMINSSAVFDAIIRACSKDARNFERLLQVGLGDAAFTAADFLRFGRHAGGRS